MLFESVYGKEQGQRQLALDFTLYKDTMYIRIRNGNIESLFHAPQVMRGSKGSGTSMAIRSMVPIDQSAPGVKLEILGFSPKLISEPSLTPHKL